MQAVKQQLLIQLKELIPSSTPAGKTASERTLQEGTVIRARSRGARSDVSLTLLQITHHSSHPHPKSPSITCPGSATYRGCHQPSWLCARPQCSSGMFYEGEMWGNQRWRVQKVVGGERWVGRKQ